MNLTTELLKVLTPGYVREEHKEEKIIRDQTEQVDRVSDDLRKMLDELTQPAKKENRQ